MALNRRHFVQILSITVGASGLGILPDLAWAQNATGPYDLPALPYSYDALEPYIDRETMQFHHDKHHAAYVNNLNAAVKKYPDLQSKSVTELILNLDSIPADIRTTVRNNGGGDLNHTMFWQIMSPEGKREPSGELAKAIGAKFGSFEEFKNAFNQAGLKVFGSGWVWLVLDKKSGNLDIMTTANQDNPLLSGLYPVMGNDVWEHAYYLKYRNVRAEYLKQWWNVVDWDEVSRRYLQA